MTDIWSWISVIRISTKGFAKISKTCRFAFAYEGNKKSGLQKSAYLLTLYRKFDLLIHLMFHK